MLIRCFVCGRLLHEHTRDERERCDIAPIAESRVSRDPRASR